MPETSRLLGKTPGRDCVMAIPRTVWISFVGLLLLGALFALRASSGAGTINAGIDTALASAVDESPPLTKSDRLPSLDLDRPEAKARVTTVKIAPEAPEPKASAGTAKVREAGGESREVTSWHWRAGSGTTRRTAPAGQSKSER
jgi:hypothetical protein